MTASTPSSPALSIPEILVHGLADLILPLAMKMSRLSPRLRRGLGWSVFLLVLLPFAVLTVASLSVAS